MESPFLAKVGMNQNVRRLGLVTVLGAAVIGLSPASHGAEGSATGIWAWKVSRNGQEVTAVLEVEQQGETLTGTVRGPRGNVIEITNGRLGKDGELSFTAEREWNGRRFVVLYVGKLGDDTIRGHVESIRGGKSVRRDWEARRIAGGTVRPRTTPSGMTGRGGALPVGFS